MIPRLNVVLMAASIVACSILSWRLSRASEEERIRVSALELIGQKTLHEITELRAKNSHSMVSPQVKSSPVQNEAPSAKSASKRDWDPWGFEKTLSHRPDLQNSRMEVSRALVRTEYQPLFDQLGLSDAQISAFAVNVALRREKDADIRATLGERQVPMDGPQAAKLYAAATAEFESAQKILLGESGFATWKEYEKGRYVRPLVAQSAAAATMLGSPLSATQLTDTLRAFVESSEDNNKKGMLDNINWALLAEKTRPFLSPAQQQAILQAHRARRSSMEFQELLLKADQADRAGSR